MQVPLRGSLGQATCPPSFSGRTTTQSHWRVAAPRHLGKLCLKAASTPSAGVEVSEMTEDQLRVVRIGVTKKVGKLGKKGKLKEAISTVQQLCNLGIQPDTEMITTLLNSCVFAKKPKLGEILFDQIFGTYLKPDEIAAAIIIRAYGAMVPPDWESINDWIVKIQNKYNMTYSVEIFNELLHICRKTNDVSRGRQLIEQMRAREIEPDRRTKLIVRQKCVMRSCFRRMYGKYSLVDLNPRSVPRNEHEEEMILTDDDIDAQVLRAQQEKSIRVKRSVEEALVMRHEYWYGVQPEHNKGED